MKNGEVSLYLAVLEELLHSDGARGIYTQGRACLVCVVRCLYSDFEVRNTGSKGVSMFELALHSLEAWICSCCRDYHRVRFYQTLEVYPGSPCLDALTVHLGCTYQTQKREQPRTLRSAGFNNL